MEEDSLRSLLLISALSILFSIALFYLTLEVPNTIDELLRNYFRDVYWDMEWREALLNGLRPLGYISIALVVTLILLGFIIDKGYISLIGSWALYLPTFGYFAFAMFFLAGIGVLRTIWLPLIEYYPDILEWGNLVLLPFILTNQIYQDELTITIALSIIFAGLLIFSMGVATWLYGRYRGDEIIQFWIYRYTRHPQYLGYILWSYGILILVYYMPHVKGTLTTIPSYPWLISTLTITAIALNEELKLLNKYGEKYKTYIQKTPFMLPIPNKIKPILLWPTKIRHREILDKTDILIVLVIHLIIISFASVILNNFLVI